MKKCFKIITTLCLFTCFVWGAFTACSNSVDSDSPKKEEPVQEPEPELPPEPKEFTITFNANDGSENPATATQKFTEGTAQTLKTISELGFSRDGYNFAGWATKADATQAAYADGTSYSAKANTTLYALWSQIPVYSVTVTPSTYGEVTASPATAAEGTEITLTIEPNPGWDIVTLEVIDSESNPISITEGKFIMPVNGVTVTASFMFTGGVTLDTLEQVIAALTEDSKIVMSGQVTSSDISKIKKALNKSKYKIELDLTNVTGLNSLPSLAFEDCKTLKSISLPNSIKSISDYSFVSCAELEEVNLPEGISYIAMGLFQDCGKLSSVNIPDSVTGIGYNAFFCCNSLTSITLPKSLTTIDSYAFDNCRALKSIEMPTGVTTIGQGAFWYCTSMTSVKLSNTVTTIGKYAFLGCTSLESIEIPASVTIIEDFAFGGDGWESCKELGSITVDENNETFSSEDGILFNKDKTTLIKCPPKKSGSYIIPSTVTSIGNSAFEDCTGLTSVTLPANLETIGDKAFRYCKCFTILSIPNSVTTIGQSAFSGCRELTDLTISSSLTEISDGAFNGCEKLKNVEIPSSASISCIGAYSFGGCKSLEKFIIPDSVTKIDENAFVGCGALKDVTMGNSVEILGERAFESCRSLKSIILPDSLITIDDLAFNQTGLTSIDIPNSVTTIGFFAFAYNDSLISVTISASVTSVGDRPFQCCGQLKSITVDPNNEYYFSEDNVLFSKTEKKLIKCPPAKSGDYIIPDGILSVDYQAFIDCRQLTSVTFPASLISINERAFENYSSWGGNSWKIKSITFKDPNGWYYVNNKTDWENKDGGELVDLSNPATNATYLVEPNCYKKFLYKIQE